MQYERVRVAADPERRRRADAFLQASRTPRPASGSPTPLEQPSSERMARQAEAVKGQS